MDMQCIAAGDACLCTLHLLDPIEFLHSLLNTSLLKGIS